MPMRGYHLLMSHAMNSTIVNDATYCRSRTLKFLLTSKCMNHTYIVYHPLRI
ncbi:hypothetical protein F383_29284 [Gossypium arboreum]|uniref:Uncharacterized protein n=1 Tax=Gossypium arboreum TaxID=29729 RepID=A0A0B0MRP6_GOSAR|nr:hypothetical protein F383_29284 [Gossypium arboreum]